jgi:hypothetical protein
MAIYLCRWPNGDCSLVCAKNKIDAIELLDEWGNADEASVTRMADCMFDFKLRDDGHLEGPSTCFLHCGSRKLQSF